MSRSSTNREAESHTPIDVSVIIVTFNGSDLLQGCLNSLFRTVAPLTVQVIVVDNGSSDNSLEMLDECFQQVQVVANLENLGFAKANNQAIPLCLGRYVLLLNNDTLLQPDALGSLVDLMDRHPQLGCAGPQLLNADGTVQPSCLHFPSLLGSAKNFVKARLGGQAKYVAQGENDHSVVDAVTGACMLLRREALADVGLLDEGFFMYAEEIDWCYRARQMSWQTAYYPAARVIHLGAQTARQQPTRFYVEMRYSRVRFFLKHHGRLAARLEDGMIRLSILVRWMCATGSRRARYRQIMSLYRERLKPLYAAKVD